MREAACGMLGWAGRGATAGLGWRPGSTLGVELVGHRLVALELRDRLRLRGVEVGGLIQEQLSGFM